MECRKIRTDRWVSNPYDAFCFCIIFLWHLVAKHLHSLMDIQCCKSLLLNLRLRGLSWLQVTPSTCIGTFLNQNYLLYTGSRHSYANGPIETSRLACIKLNQCISLAVPLQQQNSPCFAESRPLGTNCLCNKYLYNWSLYLLFSKEKWGLNKTKNLNCPLVGLLWRDWWVVMMTVGCLVYHI